MVCLTVCWTYCDADYGVVVSHFVNNTQNLFIAFVYCILKHCCCESLHVVTVFLAKSVRGHSTCVHSAAILRTGACCIYKHPWPVPKTNESLPCSLLIGHDLNWLLWLADHFYRYHEFRRCCHLEIPATNKSEAVLCLPRRLEELLRSLDLEKTHKRATFPELLR